MGIEETFTCDKCGSEHEVLEKRTVMPEFDPENMTEGQIADYFAAQESGHFGDWAIIEFTCKCTKCGNIEIYQMV